MPARGFTPFAALRHRNFRLFYTGYSLSLVGTWMQSLAQGWLVLELTNSAFWVGLVSALGSLPVVFFSLPAGVYVDRADKWRLVVLGQFLLLGAAAALTALVWSGRVEAWHVAVLAAVVGTVNSFEIPARQSFIVDLVGKDDLTNAIALNSSAFNATRIVGPTIAGLLVARVGMAACFAINTVTYLLVIGCLRAMRLPPWQRPVVTGGGLAQIREGLRYVRHERRVLALVLNTAFLSLCAFPFIVLLPVFARDVLGTGAEGLGIMTAAIGVGALAAALGHAAFGSRYRRGTLVAWASPAFGLAVTAFAFTRAYPLALAILALAGFCMVANNVACNTLLQSIVPDALRGRVMALWSLVFVGFSPFGALVIGALAAAVGPSAALATGGMLGALLSLWMWTRFAPEVAGQQ